MFRKYYFTESALGDPEGAPPAGDPAPAADPAPATPPSPAPQGVVIPDNWKDSISEEFRGDTSLQHIKTVEDMAKSYIHAQKHMGSDKIVIPGQYATPDDWSNIYNKLGRPETAEGYEVSLQEGSKISAESLTNLKSKAHELGILPSQLKGLIEHQESQLVIDEKSFADSIQSRLDTSINTLKSEWGGEYDNRLKTAANMVAEFGGEDLQKYLNETGYGNDPMLVKTFFKIAQGMGEGRFEGDDSANGSGYTPEAAQRKIAELQSHEAFMNKNHPMHAQIMEDRQALYPLAYPELNDK